MWHALPDYKGDADVDLAAEGPPAGSRVSRRQAFLALDADGRFTLTNTGQQPLMVDSQAVHQFGKAPLGHLSLVEVGGVALLLLVNQAAVERVVRRTRRAAA